MHITLLQENLIPVLQTIKRLLSAKPQLPILSCVLVEAKSGSIYLSATDLFMGARIGVSGTVEKEGSVAIPAKAFSELVASLSAGKLEISYEKTVLTISSSRNITHLQVFSPEEYPPFPESGKTLLSLPLSLLKKIEDTISFAASKDETRPLLNSVLISIGPDTHIVATDGFRLAFRQEKLEVEEQTILFPAKALNEIVKLSNQEKVTEVTLAFSKELQQVSCKIGQAEIHIRLLDGEFPPYRKILPTQFSGEVVFDKDELSQVLKTAAIFSRDSSKIVTMQLEDNELIVEASSPALGTHQGKMPLSRVNGSPLKIAFNVHYILDLLPRLPGVNIILKTNNSLDPAAFMVEEDPTYMYVIMPFKLQQTD